MTMLLETMSHAFVSRVRGVELASLWANLLRAVPDGGIDGKALPARACVSRRAMRSMIGSASKRGLVDVDGSLVRLTDEGRAAEPAWPTESCPPLASLVSQLELEHPHHVISYGTADPTMTGGPGVDWKPVPRGFDGDVSALPVVSLLSQALVAFAIEYERERVGPLTWAANAFQRIDDDGVDVASLPPKGLHSVANWRRLGFLTVDGEVARLTAQGRLARDAYPPLTARLEAQWRERYGERLVDDIESAMRVDDPDGLPSFPVIVWTGTEFAERSPW